MIEYFNRDSRDLLQSVPISRGTGFSSTLQNIGSINNKGIELEFGGDIIRKKDLVWSLGLNGAFINSKVTKLSEGADILWTDNADNQAQFIYREGESTLALYGLDRKSTRLNSSHVAISYAVFCLKKKSRNTD